MFKNIYHNKKVLITGNTGFKGSWLSMWLLNLGSDVFGISKDTPTDPSMFEALKLEEKINYDKIDIRNYDLLYQAIKKIKPDYIFHLAAQSLVSNSYKNPVDTISTNVLGTSNILEVLRNLNHECIGIIITSDKCYDNVEWEWGYKESDILGGKDIYSGSKGAAELIIKSYYNSYFNYDNSKVKICSARAGNVIGGGDWAKDRIVPDCMKAWNKSQIVEVRSPRATRPWQHVLEPLSGYLALGEKLASKHYLNGESFNFGPKFEKNYSVEDIIKDLCNIWKIKNSAKAYKVIENIKFHEASLLKLNCDKALFHLNWLPTLSYNDLINFTGDWYYKFYGKKTNMYRYTQLQINQYEKLASDKKIQWTY